MKKQRSDKSRKRTIKNKKNGGHRLSKWVLPTLPRSALRRMDSDTLNKYAKMYKVKPCKGCDPYTDKELARELSKFIPSDKIKQDYWKCIKSKKVGKYPIKARNDTSKAYQKMSLHERVKHNNKKIRSLRKKHKKEIDAYHNRSRKALEECKKQRQKQMEKQIRGK